IIYPKQNPGHSHCGATGYAQTACSPVNLRAFVFCFLFVCLFCFVFRDRVSVYSPGMTLLVVISTYMGQKAIDHVSWTPGSCRCYRPHSPYRRRTVVISQ
ncbi:mCG59998, partial [Mus musculus]